MARQHLYRLLALLALTLPLHAGYLLLSDQLNNAGNLSSSTSYSLHDALGSPLDGQASSPSYLEFGGLYHMTPLRSLLGDVNGDGVVNPLDIDFLAQYLYFHGPAPSPLSRGDVNLDNTVNDEDLVTLTHQILQTKTPFPSAPPARKPAKPLRLRHRSLR